MTWNKYLGPKWQSRLVKLRLEGNSFEECLQILRLEGYKSAHGHELTVNYLKNRLSNLKHGRVKNRL